MDIDVGRRLHRDQRAAGAGHRLTRRTTGSGSFGTTQIGHRCRLAPKVIYADRGLSAGEPFLCSTLEKLKLGRRRNISPPTGRIRYAPKAAVGAPSRSRRGHSHRRTRHSARPNSPARPAVARPRRSVAALTDRIEDCGGRSVGACQGDATRLVAPTASPQRPRRGAKATLYLDCDDTARPTRRGLD